MAHAASGAPVASDEGGLRHRLTLALTDAENTKELYETLKAIMLHATGAPALLYDALRSAVATGRSEAVCALLIAGAKPRDASASDCRLLREGVETGSLTVLTALLVAGACALRRRVSPQRAMATVRLPETIPTVHVAGSKTARYDVAAAEALIQAVSMQRVDMLEALLRTEVDPWARGGSVFSAAAAAGPDVAPDLLAMLHASTVMGPIQASEDMQTKVHRALAGHLRALRLIVDRTRTSGAPHLEPLRPHAQRFISNLTRHVGDVLGGSVGDAVVAAVDRAATVPAEHISPGARDKLLPASPLEQWHAGLLHGERLEDLPREYRSAPLVPEAVRRGGDGGLLGVDTQAWAKLVPPLAPPGAGAALCTSQGAPTTRYIRRRLLDAVLSGQCSRVQGVVDAVLARGLDICADVGAEALRVATQAGHADVVRYLLLMHTPLQANAEGWSALADAVCTGRDDIVRTLLVALLCQSHLSPLHRRRMLQVALRAALARACPRMIITRALLAAGARASEGSTATAHGVLLCAGGRVAAEYAAEPVAAAGAGGAGPDNGAARLQRDVDACMQFVHHAHGRGSGGALAVGNPAALWDGKLSEGSVREEDALWFDVDAALWSALTTAERVHDAVPQAAREHAHRPLTTSAAPAHAVNANMLAAAHSLARLSGAPPPGT